MAASTIHRHTTDSDGIEQLNNFTIKHSAINSNSNSSSKNATISSINNNLRNMSPSYHHDDDKLIHGTVAHTVPVAAAVPPAEPKSKSTVFFLACPLAHRKLSNFKLFRRTTIHHSFWLLFCFDIYPNFVGRLKCHCDICPLLTCETDGLCFTSVEERKNELVYSFR